MTDRFKTIRRLAGLAMAAAILSFGGAVAAHTPGAQPLAEEQAMEFALGDQLIDSARLAQGDRLYKALDVEPGLRVSLDQSLATMRAQIVTGLPAAPSKTNAVFIDALDEALGAMRDDFLGKLRLAMARYYAAALTDEQLVALSDFYESPPGRKAGAPETMTEAEIQTARAYISAHPIVRQAASISKGGTKVGLIVLDRETTGWPTFHNHMCRSLKKRGLAPSSCTT